MRLPDLLKVAVLNGVSRIRITGGEPLVRKGISTLVRMISDIKGIEDLSMTTNGTLAEDIMHRISTMQVCTG